MSAGDEASCKECGAGPLRVLGTAVLVVDHGVAAVFEARPRASAQTDEQRAAPSEPSP